MAKTATTKTPVAPPVVEKAETKMQRAAPIFNDIMKLTEEQLGGKTRRGLFMERAIAELEMKPAGANTYFQNLKNEAEGQGRYKYSPGSKAETAPVPVATSGDPVLDAIAKLGTQVSTLNRTVKTLVKAQTATHA